MNRIALCIGMNEYDNISNLKNAVNDAKDISDKLFSLGYITTSSINKDRISLLRDIDKFKKDSLKAEVSILYYAGHGIQANGINYIIPKDANPLNEKELDYFCISINHLVPVDRIEEFKTNILIFDSCRENPFSRCWTRGPRNNGFAPILAPSGTLIAFSTSPGKVASDGDGKNGLYTKALLSEIGKKNFSAIQIFQSVRQKVLYLSDRNQLPWESTSLLGDFYFNPQSYNPADPRIFEIKKIVSTIDSEIYTYSKLEKDILNESTEGGTVYIYKHENEIKKIDRQLFFEMGRKYVTIYFLNKDVIYYNISEFHYNAPPCALDYFDENKTKIIIKEHFFQSKELIGFNETVENSTTDDTNKCKSILDEVNDIIGKDNSQL